MNKKENFDMRKKVEPKLTRDDLTQVRPKWEEPLFRILEGHEELVKDTENFPALGKIPGLDDLREVEKMIQAGTTTPVAAGAAVGIVVVVVCVAVAARPGAVSSPELLRAKLLDVYGPAERKRLREAIGIVQKNPQLIKVALGVDLKQFNADEFMAHLDEVAAAL